MNKMNQTQTRSPRKRLLSLILAVILMIGLLPISAFATSASAQAGEDKAATQDSEFLRIFHLDCGRKYFTVSEIEGIIDQLAENHYTHIQLAFGNDGLRFLLNDMSVTVNGTEYSSEKVTAAIKNGNSSLTSGSSGELSEKDMNDIIAYANGKGIQVIPLFNAPGHMYTVAKAMNSSTLNMNGKYIPATSSDARTENWALDPTDSIAVEFAEALLTKYAAYFAKKGSTMFNIGADESHIDSSNYAAYAKMVNGMNAIVKSNKVNGESMQTLAYNDGIYNQSFAKTQSDVTFDNDIVICYWTNGANSATVEYLLEKGFNLLNNSDNWYYVLGDYLYTAWGKDGQWGYNDALNGIENTPVTQMKDGKDYANSKRLLGSILCVWCDAPNQTYDSAKVYNLIKTMAEQNPDYFTGKVKLSASDDATGVSVAVTGAKGQKATVEVKKITSDFTFDTEAHASYNVTPAVDGKAYTGEGTVTLPVPEGWATEDSRIRAYIIDNGAVKLISGTLSGGKYTFQVPHFSEMGLVQLAKGAGSTKMITVAVGRTVKETLQGNQTAISGNYSEFVTVTADHKTTTAEKKLLEITSASDLVSGAQYLIANQRHGGLLTGVASSDWDNQYVGLKLSGEASSGNNTNLWTITQSGSAYTAQYKGSNYLTIGENVATVSGSNTSTINLAYNNDGYWTISQNGYYLNHLGTSNTAGGWKDNAAATDEGSRWTIYRIVDEGATDTTTVSFTGKKAGGPVTVTVGDTTYSVTVVEKQNVEIPISIIDYRADGLLFDFQVGGKTYDYGLVHSHNNDGNVSSVNGGTLPGENYGTKIAGTTLENTGYDASESLSGSYYFWGNKWSRSGMVESELGSNGMPVYTNATVARVAQELAAGNYNSDEMAGVANDNDVIYTTFIKSGKVTDTDATKMSDAFSARKTWDNITNAYDLAWYLLNTLYQADTNMTTVNGTDGADHVVPIYGMKVDAYDRLILTENNGVYSFDAANKKSNYDTKSRSIYEDDTASSLQFYPIDGLGYDAILGDTTDKTNTSGNGVRPEHPNGSYTLRGEAQFVYQDNLYFEFSGDDDVYMYINGVLALDLGGAHGICTKRVNLKDVATKCHLTPGEVATFTFFYMERNSDASNFKIETNMELVQRAINVEKKAYDTSYGAEYADGASISTTTDNPTTVAYDLILTNKGNTDMHQISFSDQDTQGGTAAFGYDVANPYVNDSNTATVTLGQLSTYLIYVTDGDNVVESTRKTLTTLNELSEEVGKVTLAPGQSLHVRFLTATFNVPNATIQDYTNTVHATAYTKGETQPLKDDASHELYSYNASDTGRTYVVDFGLPLEIHSIFDATAQNNIGDVSYNPGKNNLKYGTVVVKPDRYDTTLTYTRTADKTIDGAETIVLDVQYTMGSNKVTLEKTLTIIPASNVYYEDSLAAFTDGSGAASGAKWSIVDKDGNETTEGTAPIQELEQLGSSGVYGYDKAYKDSSMLSMGTAHKVTVTAAMLEAYNGGNTGNFAWPTAQFTFKGTGFDIISLTNNKSGAIFVDVYAGSKAEGDRVRSYVVNNYYGYTYDETSKTWITTSGDNALYQIPVMKITDLDYGTYTAVVTVFYDGLFNQTGKSEYSFWLDAIRVYNPMGKDYDYTADNEGYPQYIKLRDELAKTADTSGEKKVVFIDGAASATIAQYANYGPNNEVYLAQGQAISFKLTGNTNEIASIQIGAKAPDGKAAKMVVNSSETIELNTATEMYYTISSTDGQFTISNSGSGILSLTNLKITYKTSGQTVTLESLTAAEQANAVAMVQALFAAPVETFSPEAFQADWGRAVRAGKRATLTVKTSADVESITVDGQSITSYTTRTQRTGWGWWSPKVTYHVFTYTITAPAQTTDYAVCAVNAEGTASEPITATLTVKPTTWWNWWF